MIRFQAVQKKGTGENIIGEYETRGEAEKVAEANGAEVRQVAIGEVELSSEGNDGS